MASLYSRGCSNRHNMPTILIGTTFPTSNCRQLALLPVVAGTELPVLVGVNDIGLDQFQEMLPVVGLPELAARTIGFAVVVVCIGWLSNRDGYNGFLFNGSLFVWTRSRS